MALELSFEQFELTRAEGAQLGLFQLPLSQNAYRAKEALARSLVNHDVGCLAPGVRHHLEEAQVDFEELNTPVRVYETCRCNQLAALYFELGVSKARNGYRTWHFYHLAVDVIHPVYGWAWWTGGGTEGLAWRTTVVRILKANNFDWGGDWVHFKDYPHFHWGTCKPSPSDEAVNLYLSSGVEAVWRRVGAA